MREKGRRSNRGKNGREVEEKGRGGGEEKRKQMPMIKMKFSTI